MTPEQWKRARLVLEGAKRHSPEDRSQYVSIACADDPELLREVESLLNLSSTSASGKVSDPTSPALTQWEHLAVLAEVGRGAFGRVYRAWDPALQTEVALKLIKVDTRQPDFADLLFHEARLLVKVRHPNIVSVLGAKRVGPDVGIWMEFINGLTLADVVERDGPMDPGDAAAAGIAICDALAAVHGAGLLHRDIKARNVMRDASGRIVLMDFGAGADRRELPSGELAGTPLYMAPEVLKGAGASVASDIYSVGVLLFHLVTGEFPVTGRNIYELEAAHARGDRVRLADRRPDLPDSFVLAVDRALSPDPAARFRRAVEFRDALADATSHITAPVAVPGVAAAAGTERWPWVLGVSVAATLVAVTFLGFLTSAAFNVITGRTATFVDETPIDWTVWGVRAAIAPLVYMALMLLAGVFVRWLSILAAAVARRLLGRSPAPQLPQPGNPNLPLRTGAVFGAAALVVIFWQFSDVVNAVTSYINDQGAAAGAPFAPANVWTRFLYRRALELTMLAVIVALYRAFQSKRRSGVALDMSAAAACITVLAVAVLMTTIPYRIMLHNQLPRAWLDGMRCYVLGQNERERLLHCPESGPPYNRTVPIADERLQIEGINESIFVPPDQAAPPPR